MNKLQDIKAFYSHNGARNYLKWAAVEIPLYILGTSLTDDLLEVQRRILAAQGHPQMGKWLFDNLSYLNDAVQWYAQHEQFFPGAAELGPNVTRHLIDSGMLKEGLEVGPVFDMIKPHLVTTALMSQLADELRNSGYISDQIHSGLTDFLEAFACSLMNSISGGPDSHPMMAYYILNVLELTEDDDDFVDYYGPLFRKAG